MKKIHHLILAAIAILALVGCSKEKDNDAQNDGPATIQLQNNQMSVNKDVYDIRISLAQTGENYGAITTIIDFGVTTGEYDGSIEMTTVLENKQIDLVAPLSTVGSNLFSINVMDRIQASPHFFHLGVSEGEMLSYVGDSEPQPTSCFSSGWAKLSHDSENMHFELSGVLNDGRKVEMKLNIPEDEVYYY